MRRRDARAMAMARCAAYCEYLNRACDRPAIVIALQVAEQPTLSPHQKAQIGTMISKLEEIARLFAGPITYQRLPQLELAGRRFAAVLIDLAAWDGNDAALKFWAEELMGHASKSLLVAEVATVPLVKGNVAWTTAKKPVPHFLAQATRYRAATEEQKYRPSRPEVPLEEAGEPTVPADESPGDRLADSFEKLKAALVDGADDEVKKNGAMVLERSLTPQIRRKLGWSKKRAQRVAVRCRRHCKKAARTRDAQALRQALTKGRHDASRPSPIRPSPTRTKGGALGTSPEKFARGRFEEREEDRVDRHFVLIGEILHDAFGGVI